MCYGREVIIDNADALPNVVIDDHFSIRVEFKVIVHIRVLIPNRRFADGEEVV